MTFSAQEKLLDAWLSISSTLWNTRIVSSMTYNECHILGILRRRKDDAQPHTATDLIAHTHLLKSQMNKVLTTLEEKGIHLAPAGEAAYLKEHIHIDAVLGGLIERIGEERALSISSELKHITGVLDDILNK